MKFSGVAAGEACTIVLRGATDHVLEEAERSLHDALSVLSQTTKIPKQSWVEAVLRCSWLNPLTRQQPMRQVKGTCY